MIAATIVVAVLTFLGTVLEKGSSIWERIFPQKEKIQVSVSIQPYNIISGITQPATELSPMVVNGDVNSIVDSAVSQILKIIQPESISKIDLEIQENELYASELLVARIKYYQAPTQQELLKEFGENNALKLDEFFQNPQVINPTCNCIDLTISDNAGSIASEAIQIFDRQGEFSFEADNYVVTKTIQSKAKSIKVIIESFIIGGISSESGNQIKFSIENGIRQKLKEHDIEIMSLTRQDIQAKRDELKLLTPGPGKPPIVDQYDVDFIIWGEIIVTNEP